MAKQIGADFPFFQTHSNLHVILRNSILMCESFVMNVKFKLNEKHSRYEPSQELLSTMEMNCITFSHLYSW